MAMHTIPFEPSQALETVGAVPDGDILLVAGNFADEAAVAPVLVSRTWRFTAFVGAGVEEVFASLRELRGGLLGPAQWVAHAALWPDAEWFATQYRQEEGVDPCMQQLRRLPLEFSMHVVYEKRERLIMKGFKRLHKHLNVKRSLAGSNSIPSVVYKQAIMWSLYNGSKDDGALCGHLSK